MDFSQYILLTATVIGVVELITRLRAKDYWAVATIVSAAVVGALFGAFHYYPGLDIVKGLNAGVGATGLVTLLGFARSTPSPSTIVQK